MIHHAEVSRPASGWRHRLWLPVLCSVLLMVTALSCVSLPTALSLSLDEPEPSRTPTPILVVVTPTALPQSVVDEASAEDRLLINIYERLNPAVV
ncbi:MAG TPA: hypothetical protein VMW79_05460, partial [Anaerolineae bacterium]|nr:hypothetical protein [Anaerolineae bacterium]